MYDSSLRERLRNSEMAYVMKITLVTRGVSAEPCQEKRKIPWDPSSEILFEGCKTQRRNPQIHPEDWESNADEWCFEKCVYPIDVGVLSQRQLKLYKEKRLIDKQKFDYLNHPENEEIFLTSFPEVVKKIIKVPA